MENNREFKIRNIIGQSSSDKGLVDLSGRKISYMRVSVTDRCNLRCFYCRPGGIFRALPHQDILTYEELYRIIEIGVELGLKKIRITGGEPLIRRGITNFLSRLNRIKGIEDISITTNGIFLKQHLEKISRAGITRINISLDTLRRNRFKRITGTDGFENVWEAIQMAERFQFNPIKLNMVVAKGVNDDEVTDMAELSKIYPFHIRFIEYMPIGINNKLVEDYHVPIHEIKERLSRIGSLEPVPSGALDGPARRFRFDGGKGEIGFISAISDHFCQKCNRLRLTAEGVLKPCLLSTLKEDIRGPLRQGVSDNELKSIFINAVSKKPSRHCIGSHPDKCLPGQMSMIGG